MYKVYLSRDVWCKQWYYDFPSSGRCLCLSQNSNFWHIPIAAVRGWHLWWLHISLVHHHFLLLFEDCCTADPSAVMETSRYRQAPQWCCRFSIRPPQPGKIAINWVMRYIEVFGFSVHVTGLCSTVVSQVCNGIMSKKKVHTSKKHFIAKRH